LDIVNRTRVISFRDNADNPIASFCLSDGFDHTICINLLAVLSRKAHTLLAEARVALPKETAKAKPSEVKD